MSVTTRFALRSLRSNRTRTIVSVAGVALAAALLTGVLACYWSLRGFLLDRVVAMEGDWAVSVWPQDLEQYRALVDDPAFSDAFWVQDVGFAETDAEEKALDEYLTVQAMGGDPGLVALRLTEGRLPENDRELLVPDRWVNLGARDWSVGSTVTLGLGQREATATSALSDVTDADQRAYYEGLVGTRLDSSAGYYDPAVDGGVLSERLVDVRPRTYTIVGVYDSLAQVGATGVGLAAFTAGGDEPAPFSGDATDNAEVAARGVEVFLRAGRVTSLADVDRAVGAAAPGCGYAVHLGYLRYAGFSLDTASEESFLGIAATLGAVVVVACMALVSNAFSISIAHRTRQFALLASVGATPRQLRHTVLVEAVVVALLGVAIGTAAGALGSAAALEFVAPHVERLVGTATDASGTEVGLSLQLHWAPLAIAAVSTLLAVLVAAWLPARRASKADIVGQLRGQGSVRPVRIERDARPWARTGLAGRLLGAPGKLAVIDRRRSPHTGRATTVSLALAVLLLVTAGTVASSLDTMVEASGADIDYIDRRRSPHTGRATTVSLALAVLLLVTAGTVASSLDTMVEASGADIDYAVDVTADSVTATPEEVRSAMSELGRVDGVRLEGWSLQAWGVGLVPDAMRGATLRSVEGNADEKYALVVQQNASETHSYAVPQDGLAEEGPVLAPVSLCFLDDQAFTAWARSQGIEAGPYLDAAGAGRVMAVGVATCWDNDGQRYVLSDVLSGTGTIRAQGIEAGPYLDAAGAGRVMAVGVATCWDNDGQRYVLSDVLSGTGTIRALLAGTYGDSEATDVRAGEDGPVVVVDGRAQDGSALWETSALDIDVAALADEVPVTVTAQGVPTLIAPASALAACGEPSLTLTAGFDATDPSAATDALGTVAQQELGDRTGTVFVTDQTADLSNKQSLALVIELFSGLMSGVLALIAVANLFNTLTNGLALRQREFAVLRSAGLPKRGLAKLVGYQCAGQALRGLVLGLVLAVPVWAALGTAVSVSVTGERLSFPWAWVCCAVAGCLAVTAVACWYGLRRCDDASLVGSLRAD